MQKSIVTNCTSNWKVGNTMLYWILYWEIFIHAFSVDKTRIAMWIRTHKSNVFPIPGRSYMHFVCEETYIYRCQYSKYTISFRCTRVCESKRLFREHPCLFPFLWDSVLWGGCHWESVLAPVPNHVWGYILAPHRIVSDFRPVWFHLRAPELACVTTQVCRCAPIGEVMQTSHKVPLTRTIERHAYEML